MLRFFHVSNFKLFIAIVVAFQELVMMRRSTNSTSRNHNDSSSSSSSTHIVTTQPPAQRHSSLSNSRPSISASSPAWIPYNNGNGNLASSSSSASASSGSSRLPNWQHRPHFTELSPNIRAIFGPPLTISMLEARVQDFDYQIASLPSPSQSACPGDIVAPLSHEHEQFLLQVGICFLNFLYQLIFDLFVNFYFFVLPCVCHLAALSGTIATLL
jgi:hypothetical protein